MKKLVVVLIALLLILTFISCVDNKQTDKDGDVFLPQTAESTDTAVDFGSNSGNSGISTNEYGEIELPRDNFNN